ncbi:AraC family transcriptional regulator [Puniceicoccus vermicola]|uniref:DNA-binding transcriptional regulator n=1 Tax=Puniceicoccus vermicola TaxID=388746 RepID=A0A7X1B135_9BACT|nr:DNA-binding transcriptional regulator [Puniceicoccus vermicola]MBC2603686.1 DNA-binding transcriptional regulator [Puniceicoccus vermicola]
MVKEHPLIKANNVALIVDTATDWGRLAISGITSYVQEHDPWHLQVESSGTMEPKLPPPNWTGDGLIARVANPQIVKVLEEIGLPVVNISSIRLPGTDFPRVTTDFRASSQLACEYFLNRGFQHFAYIGPFYRSVVDDYYGHLKEVLHEQGLPCESYNLPASYDEKLGWAERMKALQDWLIQLPKPIAIISWGGDPGRVVIDACNRIDLPVPHDVAVLSTDTNEPLDDTSHPSLSSIQVPAKLIGWTAAQMLDQLMKGKPLKEKEISFAPQRILEKLSTDTLAITDSHLIKTLLFIREHAFNPISMDDILARVPVSRRMMELKFRQHLGRSPMEEVKRLRIQKARNLLESTDKPMQDIAEACGYATYNYMSYIFKRETGISPSQYRQKIRH